MSGAYYNENNPFAAQWLRNLIAQDLIAAGDVDERSIEDVRPDDLRGYVQCHFFAGIGVWSHALRRAGWSDDRSVWTGSCPCQPFSAAGKGGGFADKRHLWPVWFNLIRELRPAVVFGEQISAPDGLMWLDLVQADLEDADYACGPLDICAAGLGAPHIRQRLFFVADNNNNGQRGQPHAGLQRADVHDADRRRANGELAHHHHPRLEGRWGDVLGRLGERLAGARGVAGELAIAGGEDQGGWRVQRPGEGDHPGDGSACERPEGLCASGCVAIADDAERRPDTPRGGKPNWTDAQRQEGSGDAEGRLDVGQLADAGSERGAGRRDSGDVGEAAPGDQGARQKRQRVRNPADDRSAVRTDPLLGEVRGTGPTDRFWRSADWLLCRDPDGPRWRPAEPGTFPLVDVSPARVGRLRAYGNAIVAEVATEFIATYLEHLSEQPVADLV